MSIGQALAFGAFDHGNGSRQMAEAEPGPMVVPEVILGQIPVKMLLPAVLVDTVETTLEKPEEPFGIRLGVSGVIRIVR